MIKSYSTRNKQVAHISRSLLAATIVLVTQADSVFAQEESAKEQSIPALPVEIEEAASAYQACINVVMFSIEDSIAVKREKIINDCKDYRQRLVDIFPEDLRSLIATNTDRRIENILYGLEQIEGLVVDSATDVNDIAQAVESQDTSQ